MHVFIVIVGLLASILLIGVILLQSPKSGSGLTGGIAGLGTVQTLGVRRTGDFLSKMTAILAGVVMVICFLAEFTLPGRSVKGAPESILQQNIPALPAVPAPAQAPVNTVPAAPELPLLPVK